MKSQISVMYTLLLLSFIHVLEKHTFSHTFFILLDRINIHLEMVLVKS